MWSILFNFTRYSWIVPVHLWSVCCEAFESLRPWNCNTRGHSLLGHHHCICDFVSEVTGELRSVAQDCNVPCYRLRHICGAKNSNDSKIVLLSCRCHNLTFGIFILLFCGKCSNVAWNFCFCVQSDVNIHHRNNFRDQLVENQLKSNFCTQIKILNAVVSVTYLYRYNWYGRIFCSSSEPIFKFYVSIFYFFCLQSVRGTASSWEYL